MSVSEVKLSSVMLFVVVFSVSVFVVPITRGAISRNLSVCLDNMAVLCLCYVRDITVPHYENTKSVTNALTMTPSFNNAKCREQCCLI